MTPLIVVALLMVSVGFFVLGVLAVGAARNERERLVEDLVSLGTRPRCGKLVYLIDGNVVIPANGDTLPEPTRYGAGIPCARVVGHRGRCHLDPASVMLAGYSIPPF